MYKLILSFRYLFKRRISYAATLTVGLCVFIVVVVMTVMNGLVADFKQKNHSFAGDCIVWTDSLVGFAYYEDFIKILEASDFTLAVSPAIKNRALVTPANSKESIGLEIMGIAPASFSRVTGFAKSLYYRADNVAKAFEPAYAPDLTGCVVGIDRILPRNIKGEYSYPTALNKIALTVSCFPLTAKGALAKAATGLVNSKTFHCSDVSRTGLAGEDFSLIYLPFEQAQLLCGMAGEPKRASSIHIKFNAATLIDSGCEKVAVLWRDFAAAKRSEKYANLLDGVKVQSWKNYRRGFIAAMEKEETILTVMFALVGVTSVFIIFVVFYMIISHKSRDIGLLKSVGASGIDIIQLFCSFAFLLGSIGSAIGVLAGWWFLVNINQIENWLLRHFEFQLWDRTIYAIGDIPDKLEFTVLAPIISSAIAVCLIGALLPSWQAARLKPVDTLQVNQL